MDSVAALSNSCLRVTRSASSQSHGCCGNLHGPLADKLIRACDYHGVWHKVRQVSLGAACERCHRRSGRIAFLCARKFNAFLGRVGLPGRFHYLIAGGDAALVAAQENAEDQAAQGAEELDAMVARLRPVCTDKLDDQVLVIGVTCGMSAPYVGGAFSLPAERTSLRRRCPGQLQWCHKSGKATPCLVGFSPPNLARDVQIQGDPPLSFRDLALQLLSTPSAFVVSPVLGPVSHSARRTKNSTRTPALCRKPSQGPPV